MELAKEKQLTERETEVFLALFGEGKKRLEISDRLHVQESAVSTCLSGVYRKFGISGRGPVKESGLKDELKRREEIWQKQRATNISQHSNQPQSEDDLFQQVRERCRQKILNQHSRMRVLSGDEIGVDQLYADVWLLDRPPRTFLVSPSKLLETFDLRNDRLGLGDRLQRKKGFEIANANTKLLILGKPGAGKTTFLKHLAVNWRERKFQPDSIAVLIEFRRTRDGQGGLMYAIEKELGLDNWGQIQKIKKQISNLKEQISNLKQQISNWNQEISDLERKSPKETEQKKHLKEKKKHLKEQEKHLKEQDIQALEQQLEPLPLQILLKQGKLLVLMDGLDEVPTSELRRRVQSQLGELVEDYPNNRLILTCRTQIIELIPNGFTPVEVADFSAEQIKEFVQNWFTATGKSNAEALQQWETFDNAVGKNAALKELTVTPVLLSLMCLVLQDQGEMTSQIDWLYKKGIRLLLSRWNDAKAINGWEVGTKIYRKLSVEQKEALLIEIAVRKFENSKNSILFEEEEITDIIANFLQLANRQEGAGVLKAIANFLQLANRQEGVGVLRAIEAHHGLLIERADELWSFSHLTFQEHLTIRWLTELPSEKLAETIGKQRWQEVIKQLVKSQQPVDPLLQLIKQAIHRSIKSEPVLQNLLNWVVEKSGSITANYQAAAIRAFYFALAHPDGDLILARALKLGLDRDFNLARDFSLACNIDLELVNDLNHDLDPDLIVDRALIRTLTLTRDLDLNRANVCTRNLNLACTFTNDPKLAN